MIYITVQLPKDVLQSKVCNGTSIRCHIIAKICQHLTTLDNHVLSTHRAESIDDQVTCGTFNAEDFTLTVLRSWERGAGCGVIVEEAVQTSSIHDDVVAVQNTETEGVAVSNQAVAVIRVI